MPTAPCAREGVDEGRGTLPYACRVSTGILGIRNGYQSADRFAAYGTNAMLSVLNQSRSQVEDNRRGGQGQVKESEEEEMDENENKNKKNGQKGNKTDLDENNGKEDQKETKTTGLSAGARKRPMRWGWSTSARMITMR